MEVPRINGINEQWGNRRAIPPGIFSWIAFALDNNENDISLEGEVKRRIKLCKENNARNIYACAQVFNLTWIPDVRF